MNVARTGQNVCCYSRRWLIGNVTFGEISIRSFGRRWIFDNSKSPEKGSSGGSDWAKKLSKSMEGAMQKMSAEVVSATRDMTQKASQKVASVGQETLKSAKAQTAKSLKRATESSKAMVKNASESVTSSSQQAMKASVEYVKTSTGDAMSASKKFVKSTSNQMIKSGKEKVHTTVDYASKSTKEAARKAASSAKSQITDFSFSLQRVLRSALWWALAAIGVYGIATTLPVELFRYATQREDKVIDDDRKGK